MGSKFYALEIDWSWDHSHTELVTFSIEDWEKGYVLPFEDILKDFVAAYNSHMPMQAYAKMICLYEMENRVPLEHTSPMKYRKPGFVELKMRLTPIYDFQENKPISVWSPKPTQKKPIALAIEKKTDDQSKKLTSILETLRQAFDKAIKDLNE